MASRIAIGLGAVILVAAGIYLVVQATSDNLGGPTADTVAEWIEKEGCSPDRSEVSPEDAAYPPRVVDLADQIVSIRCGGEIPPGSTLFRFSSTESLEQAFPPAERARDGSTRLCVLDREVFTMSGFSRSANACRELEGHFVCPPACRERGFRPDRRYTRRPAVHPGRNGPRMASSSTYR
jgi:hypothetical protein